MGLTGWTGRVMVKTNKTKSPKEALAQRSPPLTTVSQTERGLSFGCKGKLPYDSKEDALEAGCMRLRDPKVDCNLLRAYECQFCKKFHLTKVWAPDGEI